MVGKKIEAYAISLNRNLDYVNTDRPDDNTEKGTIPTQNLKPEVWLSNYPYPFKEKMLMLENR